MSFNIIKLSAIIVAGVIAVFSVEEVFAADDLILSGDFQICIARSHGLVVTPRRGIDAIDGKISGMGGKIDFMISGNPNLPSAMGLKPDKFSNISRHLSTNLRFIAESIGPLHMGINGHPIGYGVERLYAFNMEIIDTPTGPLQDQIFVQLWSDNDRRNVQLLRRVGESLYRCR